MSNNYRVQPGCHNCRHYGAGLCEINKPQWLPPKHGLTAYNKDFHARIKNWIQGASVHPSGICDNYESGDKECE